MVVPRGQLYYKPRGQLYNKPRGQLDNKPHGQLDNTRNIAEYRKANNGNFEDYLYSGKK